MEYKCYGEDIILQDQDEIEFYKQTQLQTAYSENLIGEFNEHGKYEISEDNLNELINLKKIIVSVIDNCYITKAVVDTYTLKFRMEIEDIDDETSEARLYLIEPCLNILNEEIETFVARYFDDKTDDFKSKAKKVFHIYSEIESLGKEMKNLDSPIKEILETNSSIGSYINIMDELQSEIYVMKMLSLLEKDEKAKPILEAYHKKAKYIEEEAKIGTKHIYRRLKRILDETIRAYGGVIILEVPTQIEVKKNYREYISSMKTAEDTKKILIEKKSVEVKAPPAPPIVPKKKNAKQASESKKPAKKKAESKKSEDKKKDEKKKDYDDVPTITIAKPEVISKPAVAKKIEQENAHPPKAPKVPEKEEGVNEVDLIGVENFDKVVSEYSNIAEIEINESIFESTIINKKSGSNKNKIKHGEYKPKEDELSL